MLCGMSEFDQTCHCLLTLQGRGFLTFVELMNEPSAFAVQYSIIALQCSITAHIGEISSVMKLTLTGTQTMP